MRRDHIWFLLSAIILVVVASVVIFSLLRQSQLEQDAESTGYAIGFGSDTVKAKVLDILEEGSIVMGETNQTYQIALVKILEGEFTGKLVEIDYGKRQIRPPGTKLRQGDTIFITVTAMPDGTINAFFTDFVRSNSLLLLLATFIVFSLLISGWKGFRGLVGMAFSLTVILIYVIPQILKGKDPVLISISGSFIMLAVTIYLTYGWTIKTHAAVLGTLIALVFTGFLSAFFVNVTRLTGFGSEDALFLIQQAQNQINLRGLVLGGMIIGALGVLDDLVITQSSAVMEIYLANKHQKGWELFRSAMRIGQDHVAATINTLVLAYTGAALPTMLLFSLSGENFTYLVNLEFVTEEIVRTLVGSLGLIAAVPLTTGLAVLIVKNQERIGKWRNILGPLTESDSHSHSH